jgi:phosphoribulokinase
MERPVLLGVVGDSGSGKSTITRGLVRVLGGDEVTHFSSDDYHAFDRRQRAERGITPLNPEANHLDILEQHLAHLRRGQPVMRPVYRHADGTFAPPEYVEPTQFTVVEGLLAFSNKHLCEMFDVRVYLAPPEDLRRQWKVQRDCTFRGYTTDEVLTELDRREPDSETFIRPQRHNADLVVSFQPSSNADQEHLDCRLTLRDTLPHPDLAGVVGDDGEDGVVLIDKGGGVQELYVPGRIRHERAHEIEESIWERMHFARHLREQRLGEFTIGTELHRSDSLAVVQLLILYHVVCARAAVAGGHGSTRDMDLSALADLVAGTESVRL